MREAKPGPVVSGDIGAMDVSRVFIEVLAAHQHPEVPNLESRLNFLEKDYDWVEESFLMWECIRALEDIAPVGHHFGYEPDAQVFGFWSDRED